MTILTPEEFRELLDDHRSAVLNGRAPAWRRYAVEKEKLACDAVAAAYAAPLERNEEMKAGLDHIIKWSKQSQELLGRGQLMRAVRRMCNDTLGEEE